MHFYLFKRPNLAINNFILLNRLHNKAVIYFKDFILNYLFCYYVTFLAKRIHSRLCETN